jgi:hypothetical protein
VILDFKLPLISPHMSEARIECLHAAEGSVLKPGSKLLDLSVDLSTNFSQDCPPISFFRIIVRENVVLRELRVVPGQTCKIGEDLQPGAQRAVRLATAGIIHHGGMWTGSNL